MCSIFYMNNRTLQRVKFLVRGMDGGVPASIPAGDIRPMDRPCVVAAGKGGLWLSQKRWGYPGLPGKGLIINARAESAGEKKIFRNGMEYHRMVIPAARFYEWNVRREKSTFCREDGEPLYFAGFFDLLEGEERFVILTTAANSSMEPVHDRMPLILEEGQIADWILDDGSVASLLRQTPVPLQRETEYEQLTLSF